MGKEQCGQWLHRLTVRAGRVVYRVIERSSLGWLVRPSAVQRIKARIVYTPAWRVLAVLDLLAAAGVQGWLAGGWGVDALLGRQTRAHRDVDLVIGDNGRLYEQVAQVLAREGFRLKGTHHDPRIPIPWCHMWDHDTGHKVEVLPVPLHEPPFAADGSGGGQPFAEGRIDGRPVPCISAELQLLLHTGYLQRKIDNHDVALLRAHLDLPELRTTT